VNPYAKYVNPDNPYLKFVSEKKEDPRFANLNQLQRRMGLGRKTEGDALERVGDALGQLPYEAGGAVTDVASKFLPPEVAAAAGYLTNVGMQVLPVGFGGSAAKTAAPVLEAGAKELMQSALKPSKAELRTGKADRAVETMLKEGVNVSQGGVQKMQSVVDDLDSQVEKAITGSSAVIDRDKVANRVLPVLDQYRMSPTPNLSSRPIEGVFDDFMTHPQKISIQDAQKMKQAGGRELGDAAYGSGLKPAAERDARKAIVRGLKEEIAAAEPSVVPLNARQSDLINAIKIAQNRVLMDSNKNPLGLGALNPFTLPIWMWDRSPVAKSLTARALYSGSEQIPATAARLGIAGAVSPSGLYQDPEGVLYLR